MKDILRTWPVDLTQTWKSQAEIYGFASCAERTENPAALSTMGEKWRIRELNIQGYNFLSSIVERFASEETREYRRDIIACAHSYEGSMPEVFTIPQYAHPLSIIPKSSSSNSFPDIVERFKREGFNIEKIGKQQLYDPDKAIDFLRNRVSEQPFYISDHGGYFAQAAESICREFDRDRFLGFTEFTANGEDRYKRFADGKVDRPILSVARAKVKGIADRSAGMRIADVVAEKYSVLSGFSVHGSRINIGVIGFGPIGKYVARGLKSMDCQNVMVCEKNPFRSAKASNNGFMYAELDDLVRECDIIQSANGKAALRDPRYWAMMRNNVLIASSTSADDELDLEGLVRDGVIDFQGFKDDVATYKVCATGRSVHLIANGEAANTLHRSGIGDETLYLPQGAQILANIMISNRDDSLRHGLQKLKKEREGEIAEMWNKYFHVYPKNGLTPAKEDYERIVGASLEIGGPGRT